MTPEGPPSCRCGPAARRHPGVVTDTGAVSDRQCGVVRRVPGADRLGLVPPAGLPTVPGTLLADPRRVGVLLEAWAAQQRTADRRVLATTWWYSASAVLLAPPLAGLATGWPLSARLEDLTVSVRPDGLPAAAVAAASGRDPAEELRTTLEALIAAVAAAGHVRERPLWAVATDSLATVLLTLGRGLGDVAGVTARAAPLAAGIRSPLPPPRYVDVSGVRFVRRASCCLVDRLPGGSLCTSCPRRPPTERAGLLTAAARRFCRASEPAASRSRTPPS
jgi:ferric iron reductase protein FhuF